jgi:nucleotide-binding universal stress UspA family protein
MTRILVPTDFSEPSLAAVRYGIERAASVRDVVLLLHVVEGATVHSYNIGQHPRFLRDMLDSEGEFFRSPPDQRLIHRDFCEEARWKLEALIPPTCRARIRTVVTAGRAADAIVRVGKEERADLILLGARGPRRWRHVFRRTLADRVRGRARIPVVTLNTNNHRRGRHRWAVDSARDVLNGHHDPEPTLLEKREHCA